MFRAFPAASVAVVLLVSMAAAAQDKANEPPLQGPSEAEKLSEVYKHARAKLSSLENEFQRAQETGQADRKKDLGLMITQVKSELVKLEAALQTVGLGDRQSSNVMEQMQQLREQISALTKEYVKAVNESTESVANNARVNELIAKLNEMQANLSTLENSHPGIGTLYGGSNSQMGGMRGRGTGGDRMMFGGGEFRGGVLALPGMVVDNLSTPAHSQLEGQVELLARQLAQSNAATQASVDKALRKVLGELYDHRLQQREDQLKQLEKRLADLRTQLDRQRQAKDEVIDLRVKTMVNEAKGIGFLGQPGTTIPQFGSGNRSN